MNRSKLFRSLFVVSALMLFAIGPAVSVAQDAVTLELWTFVNTHARWFEEQAERYAAEVNPNFTLNVSEIAYPDMHDNLLISLQSGGVGAPDIADIEQGRFGGFLRGGDPGLVDLRPMLEEGGYLEQLVASREALYSQDGHIYGIEHALTPVVLYYRADIWEAAGHDPNTFETWDDFIAAATELSSDDVKALPVWGALHELLLRQRGGDYFDAEGNVTLDSELSIDTMNWILTQMEAGIAEQQPEGDAVWAAFNEGRHIAMVGADWYGGFFKDNTPDLAGKWKAAPLPAWEPGGSRTSVYGGTGATVIATSPNADTAIDFLKFAMLSVEGNVRRYELTTLYPPFIPAWEDERLLAPDEYFSGQSLGALFAEIGAEAPSQYQSPYRSELNSLLAAAWQDIFDGVLTPEEVFKDVSEEIRQTIADEM
jgi:ABC-type glycerol-3-phosphate transport system substrate-binding protein